MKKKHLCKILLKNILCGFFALSFLLCCQRSSAGNNNEILENACVAALDMVQGLNNENLDINIQDIYTVIDSNGEIEGYSLGFFVDDIPYGYAIYSIENEIIREFLFSEGINNLYDILVDKAEDSDNVNENRLIDEIVYDGGIDYSTYDENGNKVSLCDENNDYNYDIENVYNIINYSSEPVYGGSVFDSDDNFYDIYNNGSFYCLSDFGLAMITQGYIIENTSDYVCEVVSATGCLNYFGILKNNNILDTYNEIYSRSKFEYDEEGERVSGTNCHAVINDYLTEKGITHQMSYIFRPQYSKFVDSFTNIGKNGAPVIIRIADHSILGLSCYETTNSNNESCKYIGVWKNWYLDESDPNYYNNDFSGTHTEYSFNSLRIINYDELYSSTEYSFECTFFDNITCKNIKEAKTQDISGNQIELSCYVPYGTSYVFFPTWTASSNGSDVVWHAGNIQYGTLATVSIDLNDYNKSSGTYVTHIYAYDANMNQLANYKTLYNNVITNISNVSVTNKTIRGYKISCNLPTGTKFVKFPTWSSINGQDDIIWYEGNISNLQSSITIDVSNHNNNGGTYYTHIYAYDKNNNLISSDSSGTTNITNRAFITNATVTNVTSNSYRVSCKIPTGTAYVWFPTWTDSNGQDDIIWYDALLSGETAYLTIYKSNHNNEAGKYNTHIYAFDAKGNIIDNETTSATLQ